MNEQKSFDYKFNDEINELDFFVNDTNYYAFNSLITNNNKFSFLYGPKKSGKSYLAQIWLLKNNAIQITNSSKLIFDNKKIF